MVAVPLAGLLIGLTAAISLVDYVTGSEISVSFFYLLPVALATWFMRTQGWNRLVGAVGGRVERSV